MNTISLARVAREWLPPVAVRAIERLRGRNVRFEGEFDSWEAAALKSTGYDAPNILDKVLEATIRVRDGDAAFERDSVVFRGIEYVWPVLSGLMWGAAGDGGRLRVLDFGGALGSTYFQNREFLRCLPEVQWNIVEQPHFVKAAAVAALGDDHLQFFESLDQCLSRCRPNVILLSSVLQYLKSPHGLIEDLSKAGAKILIVDRTPIWEGATSKVVVQHVPPSIYEASYPMHIFAREEFMRALDLGWSLVASHVNAEGTVRSSSGLEFQFRGLIMQSRT